MKNIKLLILSVLVLTLAACGKAPATPQATQIPTVIADDTIIAEGRVEPIQYAKIAFNASGAISEVLVKEGQLKRLAWGAREPIVRHVFQVDDVFTTVVMAIERLLRFEQLEINLALLERLSL